MKLLKIWGIIIVFSLVGILTLYYKWPSNQASLVFCDVGQGDAVVVTRGNFQILIDTGPDDSVLKCLAKNMAWWDTQIETIVITHFDSDHIGGLEQIFANYKIKLLYADFDSLTNMEFEKLAETLQKKISEGMVIKQPILGEKISFMPGTTFETLSKYNLAKNARISSDVEKYETVLSDLNLENEQINVDKNNRSIMQLLTIDQVTVLLTGDAELEQELALASRGMIRKVDILKVGHHGSKFSSNAMFLKKTRPEISVISCSNSNNYGHPTRETLDRLSQVGSKVYRTDQLGTIKFMISGPKFWLESYGDAFR